MDLAALLKKNFVLVPVVASVLVGTFTGVKYVVNLTDTINENKAEIEKLQTMSIENINRDMSVLTDNVNTIIAKLERELEQLRERGQECLKNDPNHPRNKYKYTIGCSGAPDDLYTHSLKKAKILCLEMCQKYGCLASVEDSKTWKTVYSVC